MMSSVSRRSLLRAAPGTASLIVASSLTAAGEPNPSIPSVSRALSLAALPTVAFLIDDLESGVPVLRPSLIAEHALAVRTLAAHWAETPGLASVIDRQLANAIVVWNATAADDLRRLLSAHGLSLPALEPMIQLGELQTTAPAFSVMVATVARLSAELQRAARALEAQHLQGIRYRGIPAWRLQTCAGEQKPINHQNLKDDATLLAAAGTGLVAASIPAPGILTGMGASSALAAGIAGALFWTGVGAIVVVGGIAAYLVLSDIAGNSAAPDAAPPAPMRSL